jgi:hypothetical protein
MSYLKHKYDNLITQDIICHGVPSPMVWKRYLQTREIEAASKVQKAFFRDKKYSWEKYSVKYKFINNTEYEQTYLKDSYMKAFLSNLSLRPSCYYCCFKGKVRPSDFTLADFWGVKYIMPEMYDNKGTSLVFINSNKGRDLFKEIQNDLMYSGVDKDSAIKYNQAMIYSVGKPAKRNYFMKHINSRPFDIVLRKSIPSLQIRHILGKVKRMIIKNNRMGV